MRIKLKLKSLSQRSAPPSSSSCAKQCCHQLGKTVNILHKTCPECQGSIWPGQVHLKCSQCLVEVHAECKDKVSKCQPKSLPDFISSSGVAVPAVLVNCLAEIESRGLEIVGLYRVPGNDLKIKALTAKVMAGEDIGHNFADLDVHVLCGVVKEFLRSLKYPLIPLGMQNLYLSMNSEKEVLGLVNMLAPPYKETLAFFMLHLQKVAKSAENKMSAENLATVLAMSVFGTITDQEVKLEDMLLDNRNKRIVIEEMVKMDPTAWKVILTGKFEN